MIRRTLTTVILTISMACTITAGPSPELGNPADNAFSPNTSAIMGKILMAQMNQQNMLLHDELARSYLQDIGETVADPIRQQGKRTYIFIIKDNSVNAVALPGGYIGINTGLILSTHNASQLAAVIAHESAHIMQNHLARKIAASKAHRLPAMLGLAAAIGLGAAGNGGAATGALMSGMAGSAEASMKFTRSEEQEADDFGLYALANSPYDPNGMLQFLQLMQQQDPSNFQKNKLDFGSHPDLTTRISETSNRARQLPERKYESPLRYYLLKARIMADMQMHSSQKSSAMLKNKTAKLYLEALNLSNSRKWTASYKKAQQLQNMHPSEWWFELLSARTSANYNHKLSIATYNNLLEFYPGNTAITLSAINSYLHMRQFSKAKSLINQTIMQYPRSAALYALRAKVEAKNKHPNRAALNLARAAFLSGNLKYSAALIGTINKRKLSQFEKIQLKGLQQELKRELALSSDLRQNKRPL